MWPKRNCVQITCNTSSACHVQRVVLHATWYEGTAQLLSLKEFKSHLFKLYVTGWTMNRWRRKGNWSTQRKPLATSFRKCHILKAWRFHPQPKRDSNPHNSIGGRLGKQMCCYTLRRPWGFTYILPSWWSWTVQNKPADTERRQGWRW